MAGKTIGFVDGQDVIWGGSSEVDYNQKVEDDNMYTNQN